MGQYTKGDMWCSRCSRNVLGVKNTHRARNTIGVGGALMSGGLSLLVAKREGYHCPACGGPVHSALLRREGQSPTPNGGVPTQTAGLEQESAPRDRWLNEVVAAVSSLGLAECTRGMESSLEPGFDVECEIELVAGHQLSLRVALFADDERASQAAVMVRRLPGSNYGITSGT